MNFKDLAFGKKLEHIWGYYKVHILIALLVLVFVVSQLHHVRNQTEPLMNVVMVNVYQDETDAAEANFHDFFESFGYTGIVDVRDQIFVLDDENTRDADIQNLQYLLTILMTESPEVFFGPENLLKNYAKQGYFADLTDVLPAELLASYQNRLIYAALEDGEQKVPVGILIDGNRWLNENGYICSSCYFGILATANEPQTAKNFAEYLLNDGNMESGGK